MLTQMLSSRSKGTFGAIVLGGNFLGLAVVRALAAKGIRVWVIDSDATKCIAQFSRYTERFLATTDDLIEVLLSEGKKHGLQGWMLFPVSDEYVELVARNHASLSSLFRLTTPPFDITNFALDKRLTYQRAAQIGIATPWTRTGDTLESSTPEGIPYPVILKPAVNHHFFPHTNVKALSVASPAELQWRFAQMAKYIPSSEILVQEHIPGRGENQFSFCALCGGGKVLASLVARRQRQYPLDFGNASTFVETVNVPELEQAGRRFLESLGYTGIAEIEFKFDPRDSRYKILDVNPRAWGWHSLGKAAGIDFIGLLWKQTMGQPLGKIRTAGKAAWMREITDVVAIAKSRNATTEARKLVRACTEGRLSLATFDFSDPIPFFAEIVCWLKSGLSRQKKANKVLQLDPLAAE